MQDGFRDVVVAPWRPDGIGIHGVHQGLASGEGVKVKRPLDRASDRVAGPNRCRESACEFGAPGGVGAGRPPSRRRE